MAVDIRPPKPTARKPKLKVPLKACDTHLHIYGPFDKFPLLSAMDDRSYTPTDVCALEHYLKLQETLGLERAVIVTGNPNGRYNNAVTLDAIERMGGRFKGLAYMDSAIPQDELERLAAGGFTGYRIRTDRHRPDFYEDAERSADRVRDFGWHVEVHIHSIDNAVELLPWLPKLRLPYILDHVSHARPEHLANNDPRLRTVFDHLKNDEDCWVNIYSFYQESASGAPDYADMVPVVQKFVEARPDRLVWGSNWPHAVLPNGMETPDDGDILDFLLAVAPDPAQQHAILVDNPAKLYGFED